MERNWHLLRERAMDHLHTLDIKADPTVVTVTDLHTLDIKADPIVVTVTDCPREMGIGHGTR